MKVLTPNCIKKVCWYVACLLRFRVLFLDASPCLLRCSRRVAVVHGHGALVLDVASLFGRLLLLVSCL